MSIPYPTNTESKHPEHMRKAAKLAHVLADDWWNYDNDTGDVEWVPNLIQAEIGKRGEENSKKLCVKLWMTGLVIMNS